MMNSAGRMRIRRGDRVAVARKSAMIIFWLHCVVPCRVVGHANILYVSR